MNTVHYFELISEDEARKIISRDIRNGYLAAKYPAKFQKTFIRNNLLNVFICTNTWLLLIKTYDPYVWLSVKERLLHDGLIDTIKRFEKASLEIITGCEVKDSVARAIIRISYNARLNQPLGQEDRPEFTWSPVAIQLLLLRYPKRISFVDSLQLQEETLRDFLVTENGLKLKQRREHNFDYVKELRNIISSWIDFNKVNNEIDKLTDQDLELTEGSSLNAKQTLLSKLNLISRSHPEFFVQPFGIPYTGARVQDYSCRPIMRDGVLSNLVMVKAVPKSYKSARIIAMEDPWRQGKAKAISKLLRRHMPFFIQTDDQNRNQRFAEYASISNLFATLDASHGSDLISKTFVCEVFPYSFYKRIIPYIGTHIQLPSAITGNVSVKLMQTFSTAGNALTFDIETIIYAAIAQLACNIYHRLTGENIPRWHDEVLHKYVTVSAYGDDTIMPSCAADIAVYLYSHFGMKINEDKSYIDSLFRESCGEDWYYGERVSSIYYPRFPIVGNISDGSISLNSTRISRDGYRGKIDNSITMLISLQKKLFPISYEGSLFVQSVVEQAGYHISTSEYGTDCPDFWGIEEIGRLRIPRAYTLVRYQYGNVHYDQEIKDFITGRITGKWLDAPLSPEVEEYFKDNKDVRHCYPVLTFAASEVNEYLRRLLDIYNYQQFLQHGPKYASEFDKLLGISMPSLSYNEANGFGVLKFSTK